MYNFPPSHIMKNYYIIFLIILSILIPDDLIPQSRKDLNLVLVYPELTKTLLYNTDSKFEPTDSWELYLMSNHFNYRMIQDKYLDEINDQDDVVIIPSLEAVTEEMIENIEEILSKGKGILITGNFAAFDAEGNRTGEFQRKILDLQISFIAGVNSVSINHTLIGNTPFSYNLMPGFKILLQSKPELYYGARISDKSISVGSYFPADNILPDTLPGIISEIKLPGRLLWFGFDFVQLIGSERDEFLLNSFNWLASKPVSFVNYLPGEYKSAGIIYKNIERPADLNYIDSSYSFQKINFFMTPAIFETSKAELKNLFDSSNIDVIWDNFFFSNLSFSRRIDWLKATKSIIEGITQQKYFGISSYGELNDSIVSRCLNEADYLFNFSPGYAGHFAINFDSTRSLYNFINTTTENSGLNFIIDNNGIFYLNADTLHSGGNFKNLLNDPDIWITTFSDLLKWRLSQEQLELSTVYIDDGYEVRIRNKGSSNIENIGIWLSIPDINNNLYIKNPDNSVKFTFNKNKQMYYLKINLFKSYQNVVYEIKGIKD